MANTTANTKIEMIKQKKQQLKKLAKKGQLRVKSMLRAGPVSTYTR